MLLSRLSTHLKGIRPVHAAHSLGRGSIVRHASTKTRSPAYAELSEADINYFRDLLGPHGVVTDANSLETINRYSYNFSQNSTFQPVFATALKHRADLPPNFYYTAVTG